MPFTSNATFRQIFISSVEAIIMANQSGKILLANPVTERMFGYGRDELIGLLVEDLLPDDLRKRHVAYRKSFVAHPEPRSMGRGRDLVAKRKNGSVFQVAVSLSYTTIDDEVMAMAFISDITERKKSEAALRRSEEQLLVYAAELEKKVESRTHDLNATIQELEKEVSVRKQAEQDGRKALERERELNELKSRFVSIASHEFRTPLSGVMSSASLIKQYTDREEYDKVDKHVLRIKSSVNHLTSILNDFLSLGKLEEGKIRLVKEPLNVANFLQEVMEETAGTLKKGQVLQVDVDDDHLYIDSDARILRNILFNLISNASKYSSPTSPIFLSCIKEESKIVFTVRDQGIGIPLADQKHMFERFFRASNAGQVEGSGLGLHIVLRYVDLLSGTISFESEYEKGSSFVVHIPLDEKDEDRKSRVEL